MPDYYLTALKIFIDDVLKQNTEYIVYILYSGIMKHDTVFKPKAISILKSSHNMFMFIQYIHLKCN